MVVSIAGMFRSISWHLILSDIEKALIGKNRGMREMLSSENNVRKDQTQIQIPVFNCIFKKSFLNFHIIHLFHLLHPQGTTVCLYG